MDEQDLSVNCILRQKALQPGICYLGFTRGAVTADALRNSYFIGFCNGGK